MNKCMKCQVEIMDGSNVCPLCHCILHQDGETETTLNYPALGRRREKLKFIGRLCGFLCIVAFAVLVVLNLRLGASVRWDLIAGVAMIYGFLTLKLSVIARNGYRFVMLLQTLGGILLVVAIDVLLGFRGWSLDYVLPAGLMLMDAAVVVLMIVNNRNWQSYIPVELLQIVLSLIPVYLYHIHLNHQWYLALICFGAALFLFLGTVIIGGRRAVQELQRRFHV